MVGFPLAPSPLLPEPPVPTSQVPRLPSRTPSVKRSNLWRGRWNPNPPARLLILSVSWEGRHEDGAGRGLHSGGPPLLAPPAGGYSHLDPVGQAFGEELAATEAGTPIRAEIGVIHSHPRRAGVHGRREFWAFPILSPSIPSGEALPARNAAAIPP